VSEEPCPACGASPQLVWVHGHAQCVNCGTPVIPCCTGVGQELDEQTFAHHAVTVEDVLAAFDRCAGPASAVTLQSLLLEIVQHEDCTQDDARAAVERAAALRRLVLIDGIVRRQG